MAKKPLTRKLVSVEDKEAALEALEQKRVVKAAPQQVIVPTFIETQPEPVAEVSTSKIAKPTREVHRFNIELPMELYVDIKGHIDHTGQTLKGFLCMCAREYLKSQK